MQAWQSGEAVVGPVRAAVARAGGCSDGGLGCWRCWSDRGAANGGSGLGYWRLRDRLGEGNEMNLKSHPPPSFYKGVGKPNNHWTVSL